jgi:hypothetical protein
MRPRSYRHNLTWLGGLVVLGLVYNNWLYFLSTLTGAPLLDGAIGVLLGLYICSQPAANAVDMLFERGLLRQIRSKWLRAGWLALNLLVLVLGWMVIVTGVMRFVD